FSNPGNWSTADAKGPALRVPQELLAFKLTDKIWVEFLQIGPSKNHVVFRVMFEGEETLGDKKYLGVRISMDTADKAFEVLNDDEAPGDDYHSGQMNIKFLKYSTASATQQKTLGFAIIKSDLTLGQLIDLAKSTKIYKFVFMPYKGLTVEVWKGC
ncbi:hypothetical protein F4604DRAFT_1511738, partial [Suillus subluteus]